MKPLAGQRVDQQRALAALERWIRRDRRYRDLTRAVRDAQRALRESVGDDGWELYLALEERMNARHVAVIAAALRIGGAARKRRQRR
jgi:hypothetical protein